MDQKLMCAVSIIIASALLWLVASYHAVAVKVRAAVKAAGDADAGGNVAVRPCMACTAQADLNSGRIRMCLPRPFAGDASDRLIMALHEAAHLQVGSAVHDETFYKAFYKLYAAAVRSGQLDPAKRTGRACGTRVSVPRRY